MVPTDLVQLVLELVTVVSVTLMVAALAEGPKKEEIVEFQPEEFEVHKGGPPVTPAAVAVVVAEAGTGTTVAGMVTVISEIDERVRLTLLGAETVTGWWLVLVIVETSSDDTVSVTAPVVVTVRVFVMGVWVGTLGLTVNVLLTPTVTVTL